MVDTKAMERGTAEKILDVAQRLVCQKGYSAFSYADIADEVGIRKASIHYHFASKEALTRVLMQRYRASFQRQLQGLQQATPDPLEQLLQFCQIYSERLGPQRVCLGGMLSADFAVLPDTVQAEVRAFFTMAEAWLAGVVQRGCEAGRLRPRLSPHREATLVLATLHGAQLLARVSGDCQATFDGIVDSLVTALKGA